MNIGVREYRDEDYLEANRIISDSLHYSKSNKKDERVLEFVGTYDDKVVGYFNVTVEHDIIKDIYLYFIGYVCVDIKYRGLGVGRKMMEFIEEYARERKIAYLELSSGNGRVAAHHLYESLGFLERNNTTYRKELLWYRILLIKKDWVKNCHTKN